MKNRKALYYLALMLCGYLVSGHCDEVGPNLNELFEQSRENQPFSDEKIEIKDQPADLFSLDEEPAIQGLFLEKLTKLSAGQSLLLNKHMNPNIEITTQAGMKQFYPANDGILVNKSGLYRVSLFQSVFTEALKSSCTLFLILNPETDPKRHQFITFGPYSRGEIGFSQILRIQAGQKVQVVLRTESGEIDLGSSSRYSGLTIEEI